MNILNRDGFTATRQPSGDVWIQSRQRRYRRDYQPLAPEDSEPLIISKADCTELAKFVTGSDVSIIVPYKLFLWLTEYAIDLQGAWSWKENTTERTKLNAHIKEAVALRDSSTPKTTCYKTDFSRCVDEPE